MIDLYTAPTPNGRKISVALEEMALPYTVHLVNLMAGEQKQPAFLTLNPNGRIPAIVDRDNDDFPIFESGAILIYLGEKSGTFYPTDPRKRSEVLQWLMFQMSALGPMQGQANVFFRYFPEKIPSVISRYQHETERIYGVLDERLAVREFLVDDYSIADMACWPWVKAYAWAGLDIEKFPHLKRWMLAIGERPAARRGLKIPADPTSDTVLKSGQRMITR